MLAVYDLSRAPPTWDFSTWLISAEMERARRGANRLQVAIRMNPTGAGFRDDPLPPSLDERHYMLAHVARPLIPLIGAEPADGAEGQGERFRYVLAGIVEAAKAGQKVPQFRASAHATALVARWMGDEPYVTISLRETEYWPNRNSQVAEWLRVAAEVEAWGTRVIFVRDTAQAGAPLAYPTAPWASVDVDLRCALYAGATLNLSVSNGPTMLMICGSAPYLIFKQMVPGSVTQNANFYRTHIGLEPGEQLPWATPQQRLAWADDNFAEIMAAVEAMPSC